MKKHTFYSLVMGEHGKPVAKEWNGFTDGIYNYYKNEYNKWFAIEPTTGLSVVYGRNTRKECANIAHVPGMLEKVKERITTDLQTRFNSLVTEEMQHV